MESENKGSETSASEQSPAPKKQEPNQTEQLATHEASTARVPKSGGPRTPKGKQISSQNSLKHGVFSQVALLKGESRTKFDSLLSGLRNDYKPEGTREELFVDILAVLFWRLRRLIIAERDQPRSILQSALTDDLGPPPLDLLLRYQSYLDRAIERTLSQLERLQRIRKGQPVPPTFNVNLST